MCFQTALRLYSLSSCSRAIVHALGVSLEELIQILSLASWLRSIRFTLNTCGQVRQYDSNDHAPLGTHQYDAGAAPGVPGGRLGSFEQDSRPSHLGAANRFGV